MKKFLYYGFIIILIVAINTNLLSHILDLILGMSWSAPIIEVIKNNTRGIFLVLLMSIYLDFIKGGNEKLVQLIKPEITLIKNELVSLKNHVIDKKYLSNIETFTIVEQVLKIKYGEQNDVTNLVNIIVPDKPYYLDTRVRITLSDCKEESNAVNVFYELSFSAALQQYIIAIVKDPILQDQISVLCPKVNEVFTITDVPQIDIFIKKILDGKHAFKYLIKKSASTNLLTTEQKMKFERIKTKKYKDHLGELPTFYFDNIELLSCSLPEGCNEIITTSEFPIKKDSHFYYWMADRPIYVNSIKVDASKISLTDSNRLTFTPFMANFILNNTENVTGRFEVNINNWVVKGQGLSVSWGPYA